MQSSHIKIVYNLKLIILKPIILGLWIRLKCVAAYLQYTQDSVPVKLSSPQVTENGGLTRGQMFKLNHWGVLLPGSGLLNWYHSNPQGPHYLWQSRGLGLLHGCAAGGGGQASSFTALSVAILPHIFLFSSEEFARSAAPAGAGNSRVFWNMGISLKQGRGVR